MQYLVQLFIQSHFYHYIFIKSYLSPQSNIMNALLAFPGEIYGVNKTEPTLKSQQK